MLKLRPVMVLVEIEIKYVLWLRLPMQSVPGPLPRAPCAWRPRPGVCVRTVHRYSSLAGERNVLTAEFKTKRPRGPHVLCAL
jgi:hypothetical protein